MRKKTLMILMAVITLSLSMLVGCGNQQEANNNITEQPTTTEAPTPTPAETPTPTPTEAPTPTPTETPTPTPTETPHQHAYSESTNKEATCTEAGEKTFTCDCGDAYTEAIEATGHNYETVANSSAEPTCTADGKKADTKCSLCGDIIRGAVISATGHSYGKYTYNNDATTEKDGTETATCVCGLTDTRTKAGTKIEICPYELYVIKYDNMGLPYFYGKWGGSANMDAENYKKTDACMSQMQEEIKALATRNYEYPNKETGFIHSGTISPGSDISWKAIGTYQGEKIVVRYVNELFYRFPTEIFGQIDTTTIKWGSEPIVIDKTLEERGIETTGNGVW